jgi:hypothetical protein
MEAHLGQPPRTDRLNGTNKAASQKGKRRYADFRLPRSSVTISAAAVA